MGNPFSFIDSAAAAQRGSSALAPASDAREDEMPEQAFEAEMDDTIEHLVLTHGSGASQDQRAALNFLLDAFAGTGITTKTELFNASKEGLRALSDTLHVSSGPSGTRGVLLELVRAVGPPDEAVESKGWAKGGTQNLDRGQPPETLQSLVEALTTQMQEPQADWETGACREADRVSMQQLIDAAQYGQPGDDWWPTRHILQRMTAAASYGYWAPPEVAPKETKSLLPFLRQLIPVLHAEIWQWRSTPAMALNQVALALDIAANPNLPRQEAERKTIVSLKEARDRVFKFSRRAPFADASSESFHNVQSAFQTLDLGLLQGLGQWVSPQPLPASSSAQEVSSGAGKSMCLWYAIGTCKKRGCTLEHGPCPFCLGTKCDSKPGFLSWHLSEMQSPREIVLSKGKGGGKAQPPQTGAHDNRPPFPPAPPGQPPAKRPRNNGW